MQHKRIKCVFGPPGLSDLLCECCITGSRESLEILEVASVISCFSYTGGYWTVLFIIASGHTTDMCPKQVRLTSLTKRHISGNKTTKAGLVITQGHN